MFPHGYSFTSCKTFSDIISTVETDKNAIGILPIENSTTSNIHENIDYVFSNRVYIIAEAYLHIHLHLIGLPQSTVSTIRTVYSHPKALLQCSTFIRQHHFKSLETTSTSEARTIVMKKNNPSLACIGSEDSLDETPLKIIRKNVGNEAYNLTRFICITKNPADIPKKDICKITYMVKLKHEPGTLANLLMQLAKAGGNLTKIESRPIPGTTWEYEFWIDLEIKTNALGIVEFVFRENTEEYRVAGIYEKGEIY